MKKVLPRIYRAKKIALRTARSRTGKGLYAEEPIFKGTCIIEYIGRPATAAQQKANTGKYLFWTSDTSMIDGNIPQNTARYINHSCRPNCEIDQKGIRIFVFAKRDITKGEELSYDYGPEYFDLYFSDNRCLCSHCKPVDK
jgi:SET domain-containing protein